MRPGALRGGKNLAMSAGRVVQAERAVCVAHDIGLIINIG
jgi:hypothetical protein